MKGSWIAGRSRTNPAPEGVSANPLPLARFMPNLVEDRPRRLCSTHEQEYETRGGRSILPGEREGRLSERATRITRLLREGDANGDRVLSLVYEELHAIARHRMRREGAGHTLQATALVNEAYLRLAETEEMEWRDRRHFYAAAAEAMRRVLIDHARKSRAQKRGGDHRQISLGAADIQIELDPDRFLALDEALEKLTLEDERAAQVTKLRFFSGMTMAEIAEHLEISERSAHREWTFARARLFELLEA